METRKKILVADDDNDLLQLVKFQLQKEGFIVQLSLNGRGITRMAAQEHPDVILLDITMDGISGDDICKKLKSDNATASIPVIMFSANDNIEQVMTNCGANDFLRKPFNAKSITDKINRVIKY